MDSFWGRRIAAALAALAVAALVWVIFIKDDGEDSGGSDDVEKTVAVFSRTDLVPAAAKSGFPVYWLGPQQGDQYELTQIADGRTYLRYLPEGTPSGDPRPRLTVGSYAIEKPVKVLNQLDKKPGGTLFDAPGGGTGLEQRDIPTSVYLAYPKVDVQIEVYDPKPGRAEQLVKQGRVAPVG